MTADDGDAEFWRSRAPARGVWIPQTLHLPSWTIFHGGVERGAWRNDHPPTVPVRPKGDEWEQLMRSGRRGNEIGTRTDEDDMTNDDPLDQRAQTILSIVDGCRRLMADLVVEDKLIVCE
jgi:hypothetical protein